MAQLHDWVELTGSTIRSVGSQEVAGLYERDWPEVRRRLLEEHLGAIEREPKAWKRGLRTASALMYGLTKRFTPERRVLFLLSLVVGFLGFVYLGFSVTAGDARKTVLSLAVAFVLLVFLLALELIDKLRFRDELELARDLQASLLPKEMPEIPGAVISAYNRIANTVGGDIYDFVPVDDGRTAILFGDASGHGMAAGLVMAVAQAGFRTQLDVSPSPDTIVPALNRLLCRIGGRRSFFSACYVLYGPDGEYTAVVAGHPPILHFDASGRLVRRIGSGSYPLGIRDGIRWTEERGVLGEGESLVFASDGIPESRNAAGTVFGYDAFETLAAGHAGSPAFCRVLLAEWERFIGGEAADDDVSLAVLRRTR